MLKQNTKSDFTDLAPLIHQALLDPHLEEESFNQACDVVKHFEFRGLCTNLNCLDKARERLGVSSRTKLIAVISFPFGFIPTELKKLQSEWAAGHGADELDVVPNFSALSNRDTTKYCEELYEICSIGLPVRAILDMPYLSPEDLEIAVEASIDSGVSGIQIGNGFGRPVTSEDINLLVKLVKQRCSIKAVGGIDNLPKAIDLLNAGATYIGTTRGPELIKSFKMSIT